MSTTIVAFSESMRVPAGLREPITLEREFMTVVAAADCGDSLLFGADSLVMDPQSDLKGTKQKVSRLPRHPLVWGFAGDEGVGFQFRDWLLAYGLPAEATWRDYADTAASELSRLNGRRRERAKLAGVELKSEDTASVLLAGVVSGTLDVWELSDTGGSESVRHRGFHGIGAGWSHAFLGFTALTQYAGVPRTDPKVTWIAIEMATRFCTKCDGPVKLYRVKDSGVTELTMAPNGTLQEQDASD